MGALDGGRGRGAPLRAPEGGRAPGAPVGVTATPGIVVLVPPVIIGVIGYLRDVLGSSDIIVTIDI